MVKHWKKQESTFLEDYRIFQVRRDISESPRTNDSHSFYILDAPDWINIIPMTREGKVVMIRQYRHGTGEVTLEIPGGMVDATDPSFQASARREMREETGYDSDTIISVGSVAPNPAIQNNRCHSFIAVNTEKVGPQQLEGAEDISVEEVELQRIPELIGSAQITHSLVIAAFYFFDLYRKKYPEFLHK